MCQKAQANLAKVRETGSTWEFHIPRIDTWGYLAEATRSPAEVYEEATAFMAGSRSSLQLTREDISGWVTEVVWGLDGKNLMQNAWRKMGYDWFFEEGGVVDVVGDNGDDVIDDDDDGGDDANFDEVGDVADMLDDVLSDNESDDNEMLWVEWGEA